MLGVAIWVYNNLLKYICIIFCSINIQHIACYCIKGLYCCFPMPFLIFIYAMTGLLLCKYEPFCIEFSLDSHTQVTTKAFGSHVFLAFICHLSHSGDLLLYMGWRPSSCVVRRPLTSSSQELLSQFWANLVCNICRVRRQEIVNFMTPLPPKGR